MRSLEDVGFIGLGQMGYRMAQNVVKSGRSVVVYDALPEVSDTFKSEAQGEVSVAQNPREIAQKGDVVVTMLPSSPHVVDVYLTNEFSLLKFTPMLMRKDVVSLMHL